MRNNQPVTQTELKPPEDQTLISVTDLKGRITYANKAFISMSGYLEEELMGQPHNIIRHPDMPEEAFRDLWATVEAGIPWMGIVKNRRKNGDYYWVRANATPMRDGDRIVGYLSVRTPATEAEKAACTALYATMQQEARNGHLVHVLDKGRVYRTGVLSKLVRVLTPGMRGQLLWLAVLAAVGPVLGAALAWPLWAIGLAALATSAVAGLLSWRITGAPLKTVVDDAIRLASGDLTHQVSTGGKGMIGHMQQALSQMSLNVRTVVRDVRHEVGNLRGGTKEIAMGNQDMSARVEDQASNLEETAASMEQINGTVRQTTESAAQGAQLATETLAVSRRSHDSVQAVSQTMESIADSSRRIGDIIQVIEGVAFQTNILALNAAVEAARAGEAGRGFAVVASEVRALAQRTTGAAREIRQLIEESRNRVNEGNARVVDARSRVDEAMGAVERVATMLEDIKMATTQQLAGTSQIAASLSDMDAITQHNAAMVEELAASSKSLDNQVDTVHNSIRVFRLFPGDKTLAEDDAVAMRTAAKAVDGQLRDDEVDFDKVIAAHQQWRVTLRNAVLKNKKLDADTIRRDDCCALGKWIYGGGGKRWGREPLFVELVKHHKTFHQEAGKVADAINASNMAQAAKMMENQT
ncbi:MAG: PAS domain-containing protein, partial [Burkholderiales bacterium]|nr:PAS domain-containing protein [Burkholderiales bacterium]